MGLIGWLRKFLHAGPKGTDQFPGDWDDVEDYAKMAQMAYWKKDEIEKKLNRSRRHVTVYESSQDDIQFFHYVDERDNRQWLSFRGTANLANIKTDAEYGKDRDAQLQIYLHGGFQDASQEIWDMIKDKLVDALPIRVTGHSLGGALAIIIAMRLTKKKLPLEKCITFGQPKVTNHKGGWKYRRMPVLRVVNDEDPVPLIPPVSFIGASHGLYTHLCPELKLFPDGKVRYLDRHEAADLRSSSLWIELGDKDVEFKDHSIALYLDAIKKCRRVSK